MSKTHERLARSIAPKQWFLKIDGGQEIVEAQLPILLTVIKGAQEPRVLPYFSFLSLSFPPASS